MTPDVGDAAAGRLAELYVRHAPAAQQLAYLLTGDADRAEDLVQEAFVRVVGRFAHLRVPDAFDAYLRRTIVNLHTSRLRRLRTERAYLPAARGRAPTSTADPIERERPWTALREPPPRQRAAIVLRYYEDPPEVEAAVILRCSPRALNQLVVRAMAHLRTRLRDEDLR